MTKASTMCVVRFEKRARKKPTSPSVRDKHIKINSTNTEKKKKKTKIHDLI